MAEAIGLGASVIAVIGLCANIASQCVKYYANVKNAKDDIALLQKESIQLKTTLKHVQQLLDSKKLKPSQQLRDGVEDCLSQLSGLETKLDPGKARKVMNHFWIRAFKWPFKSKEVAGIVKNLGRHRDMISLSLQAVQAYVRPFYPIDKKLTILRLQYTSP